jgi:hypothetical protein
MRQSISSSIPLSHSRPISSIPTLSSPCLERLTPALASNPLLAAIQYTDNAAMNMFISQAKIQPGLKLNSNNWRSSTAKIKARGISPLHRRRFEHELNVGIFSIRVVASVWAADAGDSTARGPRSCGAGRRRGSGGEQSCGGDKI